MIRNVTKVTTILRHTNGLTQMTLATQGAKSFGTTPSPKMFDLLPDLSKLPLPNLAKGPLSILNGAPEQVDPDRPLSEKEKADIIDSIIRVVCFPFSLHHHQTLSPSSLSHQPFLSLLPSQKKKKKKNHAGEFGARRIYAGQLDVLKDTAVGPVIEKMSEQEKEHLETFDNMVVEYGVRPTILQPVWNVAGYALGFTSAVLGKEAAMACTVAVETEIGEHYNSQLRTLLHPSFKDQHPELIDV